MRNVIEIIEQIEAIAPDLVPHFERVKYNASYHAPEMARYDWFAAAKVLNEHAANNPKRDEIEKIFSGQ